MWISGTRYSPENFVGYAASMSQQGKLTIPRALDGTLLDVFSELASKYEASSLSISILGLQNSFDPRRVEGVAVATALRDKNSTLIRNVSLHIGSQSIHFRRGGPESGVFDEIDVSSSNNPAPDPIKSIEIMSALASKLKAVDPQRKISGTKNDAQAQLEALHNSILQSLERAATDQIKSNSEHLRELETEFADKRKALDAQLADRQKEMETWQRERSAEIETATANLRKREAELDDRQNTHARRALQQNIGAKLKNRQEQFNLTKGTRKLRWPIHALSVFLLCVLGGLLSWFSGQTLDLIREWQANPEAGGGVALLYVIGRNVTLAAAFVGTAFFYLRWMNKWFEQHSEAEFVIKRLELDVDRASWVVETALEWQAQVKEPMPKGLLSGVSRNLFDVGASQQPQLLTPADQLASAILGTAATKVRIHTDNAEVELDPSKMAKRVAG